MGSENVVFVAYPGYPSAHQIGLISLSDTYIYHRLGEKYNGNGEILANDTYIHPHDGLKVHFDSCTRKTTIPHKDIHVLHEPVRARKRTDFYTFPVPDFGCALINMCELCAALQVEYAVLKKDED